MKRSEMVKELAASLKNLDDSNINLSFTLKADIVLRDLENKGMLPPEIRKIVRTWDYEGPEYVNEWDGE